MNTSLDTLELMYLKRIGKIKVNLGQSIDYAIKIKFFRTIVMYLLDFVFERVYIGYFFYIIHMNINNKCLNYSVPKFKMREKR